MVTQETLVRDGLLAVQDWQRGNGTQIIDRWINAHLTPKGTEHLNSRLRATGTDEHHEQALREALGMGY